jgi:hypothetical protein
MRCWRTRPECVACVHARSSGGSASHCRRRRRTTGAEPRACASPSPAGRRLLSAPPLPRGVQAYSALREHQTLLQSEQGELQATVSQMRDEIKAKDAELAKLKPDHRPSFWSEPKQVRA